ncbi:(2Fe-2S) ferredoxin domain-containing protein [Aquisalimonas sp. 2447]|uniref:(2Fe-2S) ferredoxin domain-containing protein n=1 Tax=Aquisalimonas sp. 2447 TaxID=2740807 RepID=UPI0014323A4E|nr:(2Fe-2S) ferredoxin domain-containing protein [Aquisalimonas sp. 2447]QIT56648.1 (2Fe-2S) ferredoxin domain-containing protein [Aquisalimonas sp. 2447]
MSYYQRHVFVCTNRREDNIACCNNGVADDARAYLKDRIKALGENGPGRVRVSSSGCLGRCAEGPVLVVYPEATWYTWVDNEDLDDIIEQHLQSGTPVQRLLIDG